MTATAKTPETTLTREALDQAYVEAGWHVLQTYVNDHCGDLIAARQAFRDKVQGEWESGIRDWADTCDKDSLASGAALIMTISKAFDRMIEESEPYDRLPNPLAAYLGDFYEDYDIEGIEEEVLWTDYSTGNRYVKPMSEEAFWKVCERHDLSK